MNKQDFNFHLPEHLIAQYPLPNRSDSRLLTYERATGAIGHHQFKDLADYLRPGDLLVKNNSKVIPARLYGTKSTGGKLELLVERITGDDSFLAHIKSGKSLKAGDMIFLEKEHTLEMVERRDDLFLCRSTMPILDLLDIEGHIPLPPYIERQDEAMDKNRYQTVYATTPGSVAAPTAGLHFDEPLIERLKSQGVQFADVTLHVGAGTFRPVRTESIKDHQMHSEWYSITESLCDAVVRTKAAGNRVIAVGTTAMRTLETVATRAQFVPHGADTDIFIYPGYEFKVCDGLITNFHLPESTLLMLVSAFIGHKEAMSLYDTAITEAYRFFSYGDASFLF